MFAQRYTNKGLLGKGGMGSVFAVEDTRHDNRILALKVLTGTDPRWIALFRREFALLATSQHPNIVRVFDFGTLEDGSPFYTAELVEGTSLSLAHPTWPEENAISFLSQMSRALHFLHSRGILHGDIKPANILHDEENDRYVLVDFGLASETSAKEHLASGGTPFYMAPEVSNKGVLDFRSDLYSLGITVRSILGKNHPNTPLFTALQETTNRLTQPNPNARLSSAIEIIKFLNRRAKLHIPLETSETLSAYTSSPHMMGREKEFDQSLKDLESTAPQTIRVEGKKGIGKTRFLEELHRTLQMRGRRSLFYTPQTVGPAWQNFFQEALPQKQMQRKPSATGDYFQEQLGILETTQKNEPLVLFLDGTDFASPEFISQTQMLTHALAQSKDCGWHVMVAIEDEHDWLEWETTKSITLQPLSLSDISTFLEIFTENPHPRVLKALHERSEGFPLLLEKLFSQWVDHPQAFEKPETADRIQKMKLDEMDLPFLKEPLKKWPKKILDTLNFLALAPQATPLHYLTPEEVETAALAPGIQTIENAGLPSLSIAHPAFRTKLQNQLSQDQEQQLHHKWALRISQNDGPSDQIAYHWLQSNSPEKSLPELEKALKGFHAKYQNQEATSLISLALPLLTSETSESTLNNCRSVAAEILMRIGRYQESIQLLTVLKETQKDGSVDLHRRLADAHLRVRDFSNFRKNLNQAKERLEQQSQNEQSSENVRLLSLEQIEAFFRNEHARVNALAKEIETHATKQHGRERVFSFVLQGHCAHMQKDLKKALEFYERATALETTAQYPSGISMALAGKALCQEQEHRDDQAMRLYEKAILMADKGYDFGLLASHKINLGRLFRRNGQYAKALHCFDRAIEILRHLGNLGEYATALFHHITLRHQLFHAENTKKRLKGLLDLAQRSNNQSIEASTLLALAELESNEDQTKSLLDQAHALFQIQKNDIGLTEVKRISFQKGFTSLSSLSLQKLTVEQRIRLLENAKEDSNLQSRILTKEFEKECKQDSNPEWLARLYAFQNRMEASTLFEQLSADMDEEHQEKYLKIRNIKELRENAEVTQNGPTVIESGSHVSANSQTSSHTLNLASAPFVPRDQIIDLLEFVRTFHTGLDKSVLADQLVDALLHLTHSDRGLLVEKIEDQLAILSARNLKKKWLRNPEGKFSHTIIQKVLEEQNPITQTVEAPAGNQKYSDSLLKSGTQAYICIPLTFGKLRTVLYADRTEKHVSYSSSEFLLAQVLAEHGARVFERAHTLNENQRQQEEILYLNKQLHRKLKKTTKALEELKQEETEAEISFSGLLGKSESFLKALETVKQASESDSSVFIHGESGTGKEVIAKALHERSSRNLGEFVPVNCSAIPTDLFESYFFGHKKGSFTGADSDRDGFFQMADGGTLFLDEVDQLPLGMQAKILRAIGERKIRPVGGDNEISVSVRMVSATSKDLVQAVEEKTFREDLFYRLVVIRVDLPPLRERFGDVPLLMNHFLEDIAKRYELTTPAVDAKALQIFADYAWPGNIRELRNEMERLIVLLPQEAKKKTFTIQKDMLSSSLVKETSTKRKNLNLKKAYDHLAREFIQEAMKKSHGKKKEVAKILGMTPQGMRYLVKRLKIDW